MRTQHTPTPNRPVTPVAQAKHQGLLRWSQRQPVKQIQAAYQDITLYTVPVSLVPGVTLESVLPAISTAFWKRQVSQPRRGGIIGSSYGNVEQRIQGVDPDRPGNVIVSSSFYIGD